MSDKAKKIIVRVLAISLAAIMILAVGIQLVSAEGNNEDADEPTMTVTIQLDGVPNKFPHTEIKAVYCNVDTYQTQIISFLINKDFSASVELSPGYYFVYAYSRSWENTNGDKFVINNNRPYNFYVGNDFNPSQYPEHTFYNAVDLMVRVPFGTEGVNECTVNVKPNQTTFWSSSDFIYPLDYIYDVELLEKRMMEHPIFTGEVDVNEYFEALRSGDTDFLESLTKTKSESSETSSNPGGTTTIGPISTTETTDPSGQENNQNSENANSNSQTISSVITPENADQPEPEETSGSGSKLVDSVKNFTEEIEEKDISVLTMVKRTFTNSIILWIILAASVVLLIIVRVKKKKNIAEQLENDSYDDKRVN